MDYRKTIEQYYRAYKEVDKEILRNILTADFKHRSSYATCTDRDEMIEEIWPNIGKT